MMSNFMPSHGKFSSYLLVSFLNFYVGQITFLIVLRTMYIDFLYVYSSVGDSDVASAVINESVVEGEEARKFLEDVNVTYPQVLRIVKTRQDTYAVLHNLMEYVQNLEKTGILEEKEMLHLHDAVQMSCDIHLFFYVLSNGSIHPVLGALPSSVRESLANCTKEMMKFRGLTLYKNVQSQMWKSKMTTTKHSFYPTFTHGSTLGLYEVLTGRPDICDVITDSMVFCIFLEADKIISCLRSDPSTEKILWEESAIFLSKLLLPQIFEKLAMQDLRALMADPERSRMTIFTRGETIEIPHHSVALLLEGYLKAQGRQELVTAPAALLPSPGNLRFQNLAGSGILSQVEAGCNIFSVKYFLLEFPLDKRYLENSLSARAMHLSIRPIVSIKLGGVATAKKVHEVTRHVTNPPSQSTQRRQHHHGHGDNSSDDEEEEEDIIVRIDSPNTLSFH
ncbi:hypothetical protein VNO80_12082 [Phaseolus coccineus]|uniref:Cyclic nucleotide-binding domain-containing protein n=1 Tax=Phaseolus coccineus TaxID=3886 RepID=A0AAN9NCS9_PHACN